jgi:hypothetical protein
MWSSRLTSDNHDTELIVQRNELPQNAPQVRHSFLAPYAVDLRMKQGKTKDKAAKLGQAMRFEIAVTYVFKNPNESLGPA